MHRLALSFLLVVLAVPALAQVSMNMSLVGTHQPWRNNFADVWGHLGSDGREYALLNATGLSVIDVTASPPVEVAYVPPPPQASPSSDVEAYGRYAYVTYNSGPVQIIDLQNPRQPVVVGLLHPSPGSPYQGVHTLSIADGYLYTQGGPDGGGVRIWSLTDPVHPQLVGEYRPHYVHDILVRGDRMYTAAIFGGIDIVDISDRSSPVLINRFDYPGSGAHNICATEDGAYLFVGDEVGTGRWTRVFDVRDPMNVELVAQIIVNPQATAHNCHIRGNLLFIAHYTEGVRVWDVSAPTQPREVAYYDTYPHPDFGLNGAWTAYPHLPSGNIITSDTFGGLFVLRLAGSVVADAPPGGPAVLTLTVAPNPTLGAARLTLTLPEASDVRLTLYDVLGRELVVLAEGIRQAGTQSLDLPTATLPVGTYVLRVEAGGHSAMARLIIVG